jgi:deoxyribodipyrimidine photo-lyase
VPWTTETRLDALGVTLGETYPCPMVDHSDAREKALDAYQTVK